MTFKDFTEAIKNQSKILFATGKLFKVNVENLYQHYINSYPEGTNNRFRDTQSSEHNCNNCHNFIKRYGNIVALDQNNNIITLFSNLEINDEYKIVAESMDKLLKNSSIANVFLETYNELDRKLNYESVKPTLTTFKLGIAKNLKQYTAEEVAKFGVVNSTDIYTFHHFNLDLPTQFVDKSGKSIESIQAEYRDKYSVFKRCMTEITIDTMQLMIDLINKGSLLNSTQYVKPLTDYIKFKKEFDNTSNKDKYCWNTTYSMNESFAKFGNSLQGTFLKEVSEGKELNEACKAYNIRIDPTNYMKASAPITSKQIEEARKFVEEQGYTESFNRRLATLDDIKANEIKFINRDKNIKSVSIFDTVKPAVSTRHKRAEFDKVEEVNIDKFMSDILPTCTAIEVFLQNDMEGKLVNLTTSVKDEVKQIFKWNNPFSYTFNGNLAGESQIKQNVKSAGGKVDGVCLRASIQWNDEDTKAIVDFDLHAIEPNGTEIYYSSPYRKDRENHFTSMSGQLDVDMVNPHSIGNENIYWLHKNKMKNGKYKIFNRNYNSASNTGFKAEIEFDGEVYTYQYKGNAQRDIQIATITMTDTVFTIEHHLPESSSNKNLWNLETNHFHKVNLVCTTPNHWGSDSVGNKHYLFMLENCKNPNPVRGFHNEHLIPELLQHRKVIEVLGNSVIIQPSDNQLAGIGFNATVRDELILKLSGSHKRVIKIKF